jgi:RHS repeat-associated protein
VIDLGAGITVSNVSATDATHLAAQLTIAGNATTGLRALTVTTGTEVVSLANAFTVNGVAALQSINPNSGTQGQANLPVTITGQNTHFTNASVIDLGAGITVSNVSATDATHLTAQLTIAGNAATGLRALTVTTGTEVVSLANAFNVTQSTGTPGITSVSPNTGSQGRSISVTIVGQNTAFTNASVIDVGSGISASNIVATDATHLGAQLTIANNAALSTRSLRVTTGSQVVNLANAFTVAPPAALLSLSPNAGQSGTTVGISITGQNSAFTNSSIIDLGSGITFNNVSAADPTHLNAQAIISATALNGVRSLTVTTGGVVASLPNSFTVTAPPQTSGPFITSPASGSQITRPTPIVLGLTTLVSGQVDFWPNQNPAGLSVLNPNASGPSGTTIAIFDPTNLPNGAYTIRLTGLTNTGTQLDNRIVVQVIGESKPGRITRVVNDVRVPLAGFSIAIIRTYDSLNRFISGDFGFGWSLSVGTQLEISPTNDVTFTLNGRRITFLFRPQSFGFPFNFLFAPAYVPEPGSFGTLTGDGCDTLVRAGNSFACFLSPDAYHVTTLTYTDPYGRVYTLGADGTLKSVVDLNGNTVTVGPNGITSSASNVTIPFTRDTAGRITQIIDPRGNAITYGYSSAGDLTSVTYPGAIETAYGYTPDHLLNSETDARGAATASEYYSDGRLKSVRDPLGNLTQYAYDIPNNITTVTNPDGGTIVTQYNGFGKPLSITDPLGRTTTYVYDANQNVLSITNPLGKKTTFTYDSSGNQTSVTDPLGHKTTKTYDNIGRLKTVVDALNRTTSLQYDTKGNVTSMADALGQLMAMTWDAKGNRTGITYPNGGTATFAYDSLGRATTVTDPGGFSTSRGYDEWGHPTTASDPRHGTMTQTFDSIGNYIGRTDPLGNTVTYAYDANGNVTGETDMNGNKRTHSYDALNRLIRTDWPDGTSEQFTYDYAGRRLSRTNESGQVGKFSFDKAGQMVSVTTGFGTPDASTVGFAYDLAGRLTTLTDPRGKTLTLTYDDDDRPASVRDASGAQWSFGYDGADQLTSVTDSNNHTTSIQYDVRGRPTQVTHPDGSIMKYTYDGMHFKSQTDETGKVVRSLTYDQRGDLTSVSDAVGNTTQYTRDAVGNIIAVRDPRGNVTSYEYDKGDQIVKKILPDTTFEQYTYNGIGQLSTVRLTDGKTNSYKYDARNRLTEIRYFDGSVASITYTGTGQRRTATTSAGVVQYTYDNLDRLTKATQPNGQFVQYSYDSADNVTAVTTGAGSSRYAYDDANRLKSVTDPSGGITNYAYDAAGRLTTKTLPNGIAVRYDYDANDRLTRVSHSHGAAAPFRTFTYTLDAAGNRQSVVENDGTKTSWTYDNAYRLTREVTTDGSNAVIADISYTYDAAGNRTSMTRNGVTTTYQYNTLDQLTSAGPAQYTYDARGNLARIVNGAEITNFGWDPANRLASATPSSGVGATYTYDADGRWVAKTSGGVTNRYLWDESTAYGDIVLETDASGNPSATYARGGSELIGRFAGGTTSYYLQDALGNVVGLTDPAATVTDRYRYDAWGNFLTQQGSTTNPYQFRGQRFDSTSKLLQLRARWFDSTIGRFLSRDTMDYKLDNPVDLNRYGYAASNPVNQYDPSGYTAATEYGVLARQSAENATIEGYLVGRRAETFISCALNVLAAQLARDFLAGEFILPGEKPPWAGLKNVITVAFGWQVKAPLDAPYNDWQAIAMGEKGRKILLSKAAMFRAAKREWTFALSGTRFRIPKVFNDAVNFFIGRFGARLVDNAQEGPDPCNNHAEQKIVRDANPPQNALLSVGASRPVCVNCATQMILRNVECFGPPGSNMRCVRE